MNAEYGIRAVSSAYWNGPAFTEHFSNLTDSKEDFLATFDRFIHKGLYSLHFIYLSFTTRAD